MKSFVLFLVICLLSLLLVCSCSYLPDRPPEEETSDNSTTEPVSSTQYVPESIPVLPPYYGWYLLPSEPKDIDPPSITASEKKIYANLKDVCDYICFYRDMDVFAFYMPYRPNLLSAITRKTPTGYRIMDDYIYIYYDIENGVRMYLFAVSADNYEYTRSFPILMMKTLTLSDFSGITLGTDMKTIEEIDPICKIYREDYDTLNDASIVYVKEAHNEKLNTLHLCTDGLIHYVYERSESGEYLVTEIEICEDFILKTTYESICYRIMPEDYKQS